MRFAAFAILLCALGCAPSEPPNWPAGGAPLVVAPAVWDRGDGNRVEIRADGQVLENGDFVFLIDRVGRVVDTDYDPHAILLPDGRLIGTDDRMLGRIGVTNAAPPWSGQAWLSVQPNGEVLGFDAEGNREELGYWRGCEGAGHRTCTLVSHLIRLRQLRSPPGNGIYWGVGIGLGVGF